MKPTRTYGVIVIFGLCALSAYFVMEGQDTTWILLPVKFLIPAANASLPKVRHLIPKFLKKKFRVLSDSASTNVPPEFGTTPPGSQTRHQQTNLTFEGKWRREKAVNRPIVVENGREQEYKHRLLDLEQACYDRGTPQIQEYDLNEVDGSLLVEKTHSIIYCNIAKVGSTFWKRTLTAMKSLGKFTSPFQMRNVGASLMRFQTVKDQMSVSEMSKFFEKAFSFMFVRDPYARLYSGYENKIYHPNMYFMKELGTKVVRNTRINPSSASLKYGHDVTFVEFVQYILHLWENDNNINGHFAPMYTKCDPCSLPYNFLGKLETFQDDAEYLLTLWKGKYPDITINFDDFEKETAMDTGVGHIKFLFSAWNTMKHHVDYPFYNLIQRTWSDLQIRGHLSKNIPLPFHPSEVSLLTRADVLEALQRAIDIPVNRTEVKLQRTEALIQAYRTIPLEYMEKLRNYVLKDCQLFGYDDRPETLFNRSRPYANDHLYLQGLYEDTSEYRA